jgi:hypothetical protein
VVGTVFAGRYEIVHIHDWGEAGGAYFVPMERAAGKPLKEVLRAEAPLAPPTATLPPTTTTAPPQVYG